jgi:hypothetical protein
VRPAGVVRPSIRSQPLACRNAMKSDAAKPMAKKSVKKHAKKKAAPKHA